MDETAIIVKIYKQRIQRRLIATGRFYRSEHEQNDTVMATKRRLTEDEIESTRYWFARVFLQLKVSIPSNFVSSSSSQDSSKFELKESGAEYECRLIKWLETVAESVLPVDKVDAVLNCWRL